MPAKTDYDPDNYDRNSLANIMQFIFADIMIREDREGPMDFFKTNEEVADIRIKIQNIHKKDPTVGIERLAEAALLWLRSGATVKEVLKANDGKLIKRAKKLAG